MTKVVMSLNEAFVSTQTPFRHIDCPSLDDKQHPVQLPDPENCNNYYSCNKGIAYPMNCPDQLHWSMLTYRCDYPNIAKCSISTQPGTTPSTIEWSVPQTNPTLTELPSQEAVYYQNFAGDCNRFIQFQVMRCPPYLHWNAQLKRCDFPHMAACEYAQVTPPLLITSATTESAEYVTLNPGMIATSTGAEYIPTAATPPFPTTTIMTDGSYEDTSSKEVDARVLNQLCSADLQHSKYLHYPGNCHKFIQCNGIAFVHECPANLFWNAELLTCDHYCK